MNQSWQRDTETHFHIFEFAVRQGLTFTEIRVTKYGYRQQDMTKLVYNYLLRI